MRKKAIYSAFVYSFIFGFSFMFTKITLPHVNSVFHLLAMRFLVAFLVMSFLIVIKKAKVNYRGKSDILKLMLLALIQPVMYFTFETLGVSILTASQAGIMIACIPIFVLFFARIILKEKTTFYQNLFIALSVAGAVILNAGSLKAGNTKGVLYLLSAVVAAGLFSVLSRSLSSKYSSFEITYMMISTGAVCFNIISLIIHYTSDDLGRYFAVLADPKAALGIVYLGVLSSVVAFFLLNFTLSVLEASKTAVFANLTTVIAAAAGAVFLKEIIGWNHIIGGLMILTGVYKAGKRYIKPEQTN